MAQAMISRHSFIEVSNMTKEKIVLRILIFAMISAMLFVYLNNVFSLGNADTNKQIYNAFYSQEKNTDDVLYVGTSAANRYFISPLCYKETGATVFNLSVMGMPMFLVKDAIDEAEKTQNPQLYVIELRWVLKSANQVTDAHVRRVTDSMKFIGLRNQAIRDSFTFMKKTDTDNLTDPIDYYIPMIKFHSKVTAAGSDLRLSDWILKNKKNKTMGYVMSHKSYVVKPQNEPVYSNERTKLTTETKDTLNQLLDYLDKKGKDVLFVMSPYSMKEGEKAKFNTAIDMVEDRGYTVLDFNTRSMAKKLKLDFSKDYYNSKHTNYLGAQKYTKYITQYLKENYNLPNHRGDSKYSKWDEAYEYYKEYISTHPLEYVANPDLNKDGSDD